MEVYKDILPRMLRLLHEKRRELWQFHYENALAHNALSIRRSLSQRNIVILKRPPYSPDLASFDFFPFPKLKGSSKRGGYQEGRNDGVEEHPGINCCTP